MKALKKLYTKVSGKKKPKAPKKLKKEEDEEEKEKEEEKESASFGSKCTFNNETGSIYV